MQQRSISVFVFLGNWKNNFEIAYKISFKEYISNVCIEITVFKSEFLVFSFSVSACKMERSFGGKLRWDFGILH